MGKTIAEGLREIENMRGCDSVRIARALGWEEPSCRDSDAKCLECANEILRRLADAIEAENIEFRTMGFLEGLRKPDTQEAIDADATIPPRNYYAERIGHDGGLKDDEEIYTAVMRDLLRRQRKLLGGE